MLIHTKPTPFSRRHAFTLTEVMIALALSLVLILAVSVIFTSAARTVGSGFALGDAVRAQRSIGQQLRLDIEGYDPTASPRLSGIEEMSDPTSTQVPFLVISGSRVTAYANKPDRDADPTLDTYDADGTGDTFPVRPAIYGRRSHRTDQLTFFSRGSFARQTGNDGTFIGAVNGITNAMITWGHLTLPDTGSPANYRAPGVLNPSDNPNHYYSNQFTLGRNAVLLSVPVDDDLDALTPERIIGTDNSRQVAYVWPRVGMTDPTDPEDPNVPANDNLSPLVWNSRDWTYTGANPQKLLQSSRYDLAEFDPISGGNLEAYRDRVQAKAILEAAWWTRLMGIPGQRYEAFIDTGANPSSATVAKTTPVVARGCVQFIVEFAGNFVTQNPDGSPNAATPDPLGTLDFYVDPVSNVRGIKWYGLPRDVDGDGMIAGTGPGVYQSPDVIPVRDMAGAVQPFERDMTARLPQRANYLNVLPTQAMGANDNYVCVWALDNANPLVSSIATPPKLIRVTVQLADENGRLADGFTQEYVFRVP